MDQVFIDFVDILAKYAVDAFLIIIAHPRVILDPTLQWDENSNQFGSRFYK